MPWVNTSRRRHRRRRVCDQIPVHDPAIHGRYHSGIKPSIHLNPKHVAANPLEIKRTYHLHTYDHDAPPPNDRFHHPLKMHPENWNSAGRLDFNGDGTMTIAGHKVKAAEWKPALSTVSWTSQPGGITGGALSFSNDRASVLGHVFLATGTTATVAGSSLAYYHTKHRMAATDTTAAGQWSDFKDFVFGTKPFGTGTALDQVVLLTDPTTGATDDVSTECAVDSGGFGGSFTLSKQTSSDEHHYTFSATFDFMLDSFTGTYTVFGRVWEWTGATYTPATDAPGMPPTTTTPIPTSATPQVPLPITSPPPDSGPSVATVRTLPHPKALFVSPPSAPTVAATASPSLQDLLHLSSLTVVSATINGVSTITVKDYAQEQANQSYHKMLLQSVPDATKQALYPNADKLTASEQAVVDDNKEYFQLASIPFLAQYLDQASSVSQDVKDHINMDKIGTLWEALPSVSPPKQGVDPCATMGWDRSTRQVKDWQSQNASQHLECFKLGYTVGVPAFQPFLDDAGTWFDQLAKYLQNPNFLARWSLQNSQPSFTEGHRQLYEWNTQLSVLKKHATATGQKTVHDPDAVVNVLTTATLMPSFDTVNWGDEIHQHLKDQLESIMSLTRADLDAIFKSNQDQYNNTVAIMEAVQTYGTIDEFITQSDNSFRIIQKYFNINDVGDLAQIQTAYADAFASGAGPQDDRFISQVGDAYVAELAGELEPQAGKWQTLAAKIKTSIGGALKPLMYAACVGATIYALVAFNQGLSPIALAQLSGVCLEFSLKTIESLAATKLGTWIGDQVCSKTGMGEMLGKWFSKNGEAFVDEGTALAKIFTKNVAEFICNRLGPLLAIIAVAISVNDLVTALSSGTQSDVIYASISLALAVIDAVIVFVGIAAVGAEVGTTLAVAGAMCGPLGIIVALVGVAVFIVSLFCHSQPDPPNPTKDFVDGPLNDAGLKK